MLICNTQKKQLVSECEISTASHWSRTSAGITLSTRTDVLKCVCRAAVSLCASQPITLITPMCLTCSPQAPSPGLCIYACLSFHSLPHCLVSSALVSRDLPGVLEAFFLGGGVSLIFLIRLNFDYWLPGVIVSGHWSSQLQVLTRWHIEAALFIVSGLRQKLKFKKKKKRKREKHLSPSVGWWIIHMSQQIQYFPLNKLLLTTLTITTHCNDYITIFKWPMTGSCSFFLFVCFFFGVEQCWQVICIWLYNLRQKHNRPCWGFSEGESKLMKCIIIFHLTGPLSWEDCLASCSEINTWQSHNQQLQLRENDNNNSNNYRELVLFHPVCASDSETLLTVCVRSSSKGFLPWKQKKKAKNFFCIHLLLRQEHKNADLIRGSGCQQESIFGLQWQLIEFFINLWDQAD